MAYLTINGVDVKVRSSSASMSPTLIGASKRSIGGTLLRDVRAQKREWRKRTPPLSLAEAEALIGLINGRGQHFGFESDAVSDSGLTPASGITGAVYHGANAADGDPQKIIHTAPATTGNLYATGSALWPATATTNLLSKVSSDADEDGGATNGYSQIQTPATFATNTSHYWQGARSIEVEDDGGQDCGIETVATAAGTHTNGETVTGSVWIKGTGATSVTVTVQAYQSDGSTPTDNSSTVFTLAANEWRRCWVTHTTSHVDSSRASIKIVHGTASATMYVDGFMIAELDYVTPWVVGAGSYSVVAPICASPFPAGAKAITVAGWTNGSASADAAVQAAAMVSIEKNSSNKAAIVVVSSTNMIRAQYYSGGSTTSTTGTTAIPFGTIGHFAMTLDLATAVQRVYVNGSEEDSDTITDDLWDLDDVDTLAIGAYSGGGYAHNGFIDQLIIAPYAMTASQIEDLYNSGTPQLVGIPKLKCVGDFVGEASVTCLGRVERMRNIPITINGTHANNAAELDFSLLEV